MDSNVKITFWLYRARVNSKKQMPIYLRVRNNNENFSKSTGLFIKEANWDKKIKRVKGSNPEAYSINSQLDGIKLKILQIVNEFNLKGKPFTVENFADHISGLRPALFGNKINSPAFYFFEAPSENFGKSCVDIFGETLHIVYDDRVR